MKSRQMCGHPLRMTPKEFDDVKIFSKVFKASFLIVYLQCFVYRMPFLPSCLPT